MAKEKKVFDKGMIEEFAQIVSSERARRVFYLLSENADEIALNLSQTKNLITSQNIDFVLGGDVLTNTLTPSSELEFYLTVRSAQIELNTLGTFNNRFGRFLKKLKSAWENRKTKIFGKRREKKKDKAITEKQLVEKKEKPYSLVEFKNDFFDGFVDRLTNLTVVYNMPNRIKILARDEFGYKINIIPAIKHDTYIKIWNEEKKKFIEIQPNQAKQILDEKAKEIENQCQSSNGEILFQVIRIFKNLFYNLRQSFNYQFVESMVYSCPNSLFKTSEKNEVYDVFIKILNYLLNAPISQIRSIYNFDRTIYEQGQTTAYSLVSFLKEVKVLLG